MNKSRLFVKSYAVINKTPYYYFPVDSQPIVNPSQLEEEVLLSVPLRHPEEARTVYGVLTISSRRASSKLVDISNEDVETGSKYNEFFDLVTDSCFKALS
jgi:hypothetical protein